MIDYNRIKEDAIGRWHGIFSGLGIDVGDGRHQGCPICGTGKDKFRFDDKEGKGTWFCNSCGAGDGWLLIQKKMGISFKESIEEVGKIIGSCEVNKAPKEATITPEALRKIFMSSIPISWKDIAGKYLKKRGLNKISPMLRYTSKCWESETKKNQHAMLAVFTGCDNQAVTMHRTYLTDNSEKIKIKSPKKILPSLKKMTGGAVRLFPFESGVLGIAEGIETAIAASQDISIPVWAALSSTLLESFEPPKNIDSLIIIADNDANFAGQKAAYALAHKMAIKGINVKVYVPEFIGNDWLDVVNRQKK